MADKDCLMYSWNLHCGEFPRPLRKHLPKKSERVVKKTDRRKKVHSKDLQDNGRFRSVVKVFTLLDGCLYEGTGWLIQPDLVVTAGHNVVELSKRVNSRIFATNVRVYIGYSGKDTMNDPHADVRRGTMVVVPRNYAINHKSVNDFAFVKLSRPFNDVTPIEPLITPRSGKAKLCVVGYPADKKKKCLNGGKESGAEMYKDNAQVIWKLKLHDGLLAYQISTYRGNSGSPVLYVKGGITFAIGTHVESEGKWNFASPITENSVNSYRSIINHFFSGAWPKPRKAVNMSSFAGNTRVEVHRLRPASTAPS